jgi:FlaA1/EpsC-like NDP-sugar epimerase
VNSFLLKLPRKVKQLILLLIDLFIVVSSIFIAFYVRLGSWHFPSNDLDLFLAMFIFPIFSLPVFWSFGMYSQIIRYVGFKALWGIIKAVSLYAILWGLITLMAKVESIPRSVILINWLLVVISISGVRFFAQWALSEIKLKNNVLIYGAGSAGRQLSTALAESKEYKPVGFIDDSNEIYSRVINGLKVYSTNNFEDLIKRKKIKEVLIAIPSISRVMRKKIIDFLEPYPVIVRSLPGVSELATGKVKVEDLFEIDLKDLLGRESFDSDNDLLQENIVNKVVMVTGAGGSIGSEICRQIFILKPKKIILFDISESSIYLINQELQYLKHSNVEIFPVIGSVIDIKRMEYICSYYKVNTIYHAAAYKHVPLVEFNQTQGVLNNAIGTMNAAQAAISSNVETFVLISTDKAVRPTNVMGASKRIAELVLQAYAKKNHNTCFTMVRFGNVLDSSGSVIPLFRKQIESGGPITLTHVDVVRYFMTIPEAVRLVIQAGAMAKGGEVFVLNMGEPMRIYDLAIKMINLSGLTVLDDNHPDGDIRIVYTGLRPGEKLYEELLIDGDFSKTQNEFIMRAEEEMITWDKLKPILAEIDANARNGNSKKTMQLVRHLVPQYSPNNK